jgi:hypothetical protein
MDQPGYVLDQMILLHFIRKPATQPGLELQTTPPQLLEYTPWREAKYVWGSDFAVI